MEQIVQEIEEIRETSNPVEILFEDESHFNNEPYVQRGWFRKGSQHKAPTPYKRERTTLFGALHLKTQKFYWKHAQCGNSKAFIEFLHQLHQRFPQALIILILDNGRIHKSRRVQQFLKKHAWIQLKFLLPYSPEFNPIERFWLWLKSKVYGAYAFDSIEKVIQRIRKFVWHYHENWLVFRIRFRFQPYQNLL